MASQHLTFYCFYLSLAVLGVLTLFRSNPYPLQAKALSAESVDSRASVRKFVQ